MSCSSDARELLTFWVAGTLTRDEADAVARHVAGCDDCRAAAVEGAALVEGIRQLHLQADEIVAAAAGDLTSPHLLVCPSCRDEVALLRGVNGDLSKPFAGPAVWRSPVGLAAAAVVVLAVTAIWYVRQGQHPVPPAQPPVVAAAPAPLKIVVEKASLTALATETVRLRGSTDARRRMLDDLATALEPYRRDDYASSTTRLAALHNTYPDAPEIPYYLGVCLLLQDRPAEAIAPLQDAVRPRSAPSAVAPDEAAYYLAVARANAGQTAAALPELTRLCGGAGDVSARACAALRQVPDASRR